MKPINSSITSCRHCHYYSSEGRRGGSCGQLGVQVEANWKACPLALALFASDWNSLDDIVLLETSYSLTCSEEETKVEELTATTPKLVRAT